MSRINEISVNKVRVVKLDLDSLESAIKEYQENKFELLKKLDEVQIELREHLKKMLS